MKTFLTAGTAAACVVASCVVAGAPSVYGATSAGRSLPVTPSPAGSGSKVAGTEASVTTDQVDQGLVDINAVIGHQDGISSGTGMVLTPSGEVLTNYHIISGATSITGVDRANGHRYPASVVGYSRAADVAVLSLTGASGLPTAVIGDSKGVHVGAAVTAFGNALGMDGIPSQATGTVTALNQAVTAVDSQGGSPEYLTGLIGTSAVIEPGDSGGPLVDTSGAVIGMETALVNRSVYGSTPVDSYAVPIDTARAVAAELTALHSRPLFGVEVSSAVYPGGGIPVTEIEPGSPAAATGLVPGDTITSFDGQRVTSGYGLEEDILSSRPGAVATVTWLDRSGYPRQASVALVSWRAES